ncbi:hypothetical protein SLS58_009885 [Diplodia intermedia]|uniref:Uncharacterized protein n=1 Tax=Diplodia intermedia TaxID=856260 RepID=A0ABR3TA16_9PEZI
MPDDTIGTEDEHHPKHRDPYRFIPADEFFDRELSANTLRPDSVTYNEKDQLDATGNAQNPACGHGRVFRLSTGALMLIQFMRPLVWRIRFYPHYKEGHEFTDYNTRTIIRAELSKMIEILDRAEGIEWSVQFDDSNPRYYNLRSVDKSGNPTVQLWIQRDPFRIMATRTIKMHLRDDELPISAPAESGQAVIWKTKKRPLQYQVRDTQQEPSAIVLSVEKPDPARYMGFGEQGGNHLFKDNTYMNYFNFDNMRYNNVYGRGPFENAEPLYHSGKTPQPSSFALTNCM